MRAERVILLARSFFSKAYCSEGGDRRELRKPSGKFPGKTDAVKLSQPNKRDRKERARLPPAGFGPYTRVGPAWRKRMKERQRFGKSDNNKRKKKSKHRKGTVSEYTGVRVEEGAERRELFLFPELGGPSFSGEPLTPRISRAEMRNLLILARTFPRRPPRRWTVSLLFPTRPQVPAERTRRYSGSRAVETREGRDAATEITDVSCGRRPLETRRLRSRTPVRRKEISRASHLAAALSSAARLPTTPGQAVNDPLPACRKDRT